MASDLECTLERAKINETLHLLAERYIIQRAFFLASVNMTCALTVRYRFTNLLALLHLFPQHRSTAPLVSPTTQLSFASVVTPTCFTSPYLSASVETHPKELSDYSTGHSHWRLISLTMCRKVFTINSLS